MTDVYYRPKVGQKVQIGGCCNADLYTYNIGRKFSIGDTVTITKVDYKNDLYQANDEVNGWLPMNVIKLDYKESEKIVYVEKVPKK